jgi:magnesium transporter
MTHKSLSGRHEKSGMAPGSLVHVGRQKVVETSVNVLEYDSEGQIHAWKAEELEQLQAVKATAPVSWIDVIGLHQIETIETIGRIFAIHPLLLEDILNTEQRPKADQYGDHLYVILKVFQWYGTQPAVGQPISGGAIAAEQVSIVLGQRFVITFQEHQQDIFDPLRERIRSGHSRLYERGADYLAYSLLDTVVDQYFVILEALGELIEDIEDEVVSNPTPTTLQSIYELKQELIFLRRSVWPLREILNVLQRGDSPLIDQETVLYLRDVYEHTVQVIDTIETYREIVSGLIDIYLSSVSNRMNEIMKLLTLIATIFIPLTFITSLYGMNFRYMPELGWRWGYPLTWLVIVLISGGMVIYFRRRRWL